MTTVGNATYASAGNYVWEINSLVGTKGTDPGWDWHNITGSLNIASNSSTPFVINISGLNTGNTAGEVSGWDPHSTYNWVLASAAGGITGFTAANQFTLTSSTNFTNNNPIGNGSFTISAGATYLTLTFSAATVVSEYFDNNGTTTGAGGAS